MLLQLNQRRPTFPYVGPSHQLVQAYLPEQLAIISSKHAPTEKTPQPYFSQGADLKNPTTVKSNAARLA